MQAIVKLFAKQNELTFEQIKSQLEEKLADRTLRRYLKELEARGVLSLHGRGRHALWIWGTTKED